MSRPEERDPERMSFSKVWFLVFIAMVINCPALIAVFSEIYTLTTKIMQRIE